MDPAFLRGKQDDPTRTPFFSSTPGALDKEETKKFVQDTLGNLGSGDEFSQEAFDEVFSTFDKDNSGTVEKSEMVVFIKQLLGGN